MTRAIVGSSDRAVTQS